MAQVDYMKKYRVDAYDNSSNLITRMECANLAEVKSLFKKFSYSMVNGSYIVTENTYYYNDSTHRVGFNSRTLTAEEIFGG